MALTENEIRPNELNEGKEEALQKDLKWLKNLKFKFIKVSCPACESQFSISEFEKYSFNFVRCNECRTVYMNPRATPEILGEFYKNSKLYSYWNKYIFPASESVRRDKIFRPRAKKILDLCKQYKVKTDCFVEVGAANGFMCTEIKRAENFGRVIGIEPGKDLAKSCRNYGVETIEDTIENITNADLKADVIASFEVIEHVFSPKTFLHNCKRLLVDRGLIIISCPNYEGFDIQVLGENSESLDAEHINMFNPDSIRLLMEQCGFEVLECTTPGELDADIVRSKVLEGKLDLDNQIFLKNILVNRWDEVGEAFQKFLKENLLSSHMWVVARTK